MGGEDELVIEESVNLVELEGSSYKDFILSNKDLTSDGLEFTRTHFDQEKNALYLFLRNTQSHPVTLDLSAFSSSAISLHSLSSLDYLTQTSTNKLHFQPNE